MDYRDRIIELRKEKGISQAQLAIQLNVSQSAVAKWELKKTEPTATAIISMSRFFDVSSDYILGLVDEWGNRTNSINNSFNFNNIQNSNIKVGK